MTRLILLFVLLAAPSVHAADFFTLDCPAIEAFHNPEVLLRFEPQRWDVASQSLAGAYLFFQAVDMLQTLIILNDDHFHESNQAIQWTHDNFGDVGVVGYFVGEALINLWIADKLPPWMRIGFNLFLLAGESDAVRWNLKCGVRF